MFSHFAARFFSLFYHGNKVECPVCDHHYRKFLPYGRGKARQNALCPNCLSLERHRLLYLYLKNRTDLFIAPLKFLHIAPELCFLKLFNSLPNLDYITADLESPWAKVHFDVHEIPFEDNSFDVVMCNHLLEHVRDDIMAMKEIRRVMKPGGWGIMQVPVNESREKTYEDHRIKTPGERRKHFGQNDHVRDFGKDYPERLSKAGFTVKVDDYITTLSSGALERYSVKRGEGISFEDMIFRVEK